MSANLRTAIRKWNDIFCSSGSVQIRAVLPSKFAVDLIKCKYSMCETINLYENAPSKNWMKYKWTKITRKRRKKTEEIKSTEMNGGSKFLFIHSFAFSFVCQAAADVFFLNCLAWMSLHVAGEFPLNSASLLLNVRINFLSCTTWTHVHFALTFFDIRWMTEQIFHLSGKKSRRTHWNCKTWFKFHFLVSMRKMLKNEIIWQINGFKPSSRVRFFFASSSFWCCKSANRQTFAHIHKQTRLHISYLSKCENTSNDIYYLFILIWVQSAFFRRLIQYFICFCKWQSGAWHFSSVARWLDAAVKIKRK